MNNKDIVLSAMRSQGRADAMDLRTRSTNMTPTEIIAEEEKVPKFDNSKDYSQYPVGSPVRELVDGEWQIFTLIQPYNAAHYPDSTPSRTRAIWSLAHTKDPAKAKPWVASLGTSGMYMIDEVCTRIGRIWRSKKDKNSHEPGVIGTEEFWEDVGEVQN